MSLCYCLTLLFSILLLLFFEVTYEASASLDCMSDCTSPSETPSLYYQYCCLSPNNGRRIEMIKDDLVTIIVCPFNGLPESFCETTGSNYYSCSEVLERLPNTASGYYSLTLTNGSIISVYCDMEGSNCDGNGGWMRIGYVNMTEPGSTCPQGLYIYSFGGKTVCDRLHSSTSLCNSTFFSSMGVNYTEVCGQVRGYELGSFVDGFYPNGRGGSSDINRVYVDGVSITYGSNPRKHIWTYAAGYAEDKSDNPSCPCNSDYSGDSTPNFVGNDYYCEAGTIDTNLTDGRLYPDDPLWDGLQCNNLESPCCNSTGMPWFVRSIANSTDDDIELRMCSSEGYPDEATPIDIIELYIR